MLSLPHIKFIYTGAVFYFSVQKNLVPRDGVKYMTPKTRKEIENFMHATGYHL